MLPTQTHSILHLFFVAAICILAAPSPLNAQEAEYGDHSPGSDYRFLGIARAVQQATLRIPKQGLLQSVPVKEGQRVEAGDVLLSLDDRIARAALELARTEAANIAALKISKIERDRLTIALDRARTGFQQKVVGQFELDAKRSEYERALAAFELELEKQAQLNARLHMAQQEANSMSLFAPFEGTVTQIYAKVGDALGPSENAIALANIDFLEIEFHLPLSLYGKIKEGKEYQVRAGQPVDKNLTVRARFVSPEVESTSGTFRTVFEFDNRAFQYPSGFEVYFIDQSKSPARVSLKN